MNTTIRVLTKCCYGLFGIGCLVLGSSVLLIDTGLLPAGVKGALLEESRGDLNTLHLMQEFGTLLVFASLVAFWFIRHYERSQFFHWSLTLFWGLLALVHWVDVRGPEPSVGGLLVLTIPFVVFVVLGLLRLASEGHWSRAETPNGVDRVEPQRSVVSNPR